MKNIIILSIGLCVASLIFLIGWHERNERATKIMALISVAGLRGSDNGDAIRRYVLELESAGCGRVTNVIIMPDHVAVFGTKGSSQWWP